MLLRKKTSAPSSQHSTPPLCIIHHRGLLLCFPRLFLPSVPVTLTESPNPLLLPTASLPPSGSWITFLFFCSPTLGTSEPLTYILYILFLYYSALLPDTLSTLHCPLSYVFQSFILVFPVPWEYPLRVSLEHSHRLLSCCNSVADIPSCTLSVTISAISVYSKILQCWHQV